ncbi:MAG: hypothetical protein IJ265_07680 [Oscillospiraceae bacterium]|nr:hypothetical protein [Oscillospiraceae bacterium]
MITNKKLYEMMVEQMSNSNGALREQLKEQIMTGANENQTMMQALMEQQHTEITELSAQTQNAINALQSELRSELGSTAAAHSQMVIQQLTQEHTAKMDALKTELLAYLDERLGLMMQANKILSDHIADLQKDTAVIMETLQLILTNMMLDKVENGLTEGEIFGT